MTSAADSQRWSEVRMTIRRNGPHHGLVTVIHRTVDGQKHWDRRLDTATFDRLDASGVEVDLPEALRRAVAALEAGRQRG
jgi:hypothetical protein